MWFCRCCWVCTLHSQYNAPAVHPRYSDAAVNVWQHILVQTTVLSDEAKQNTTHVSSYWWMPSLNQMSWVSKKQRIKTITDDALKPSVQRIKTITDDALKPSFHCDEEPYNIKFCTNLGCCSVWCVHFFYACWTQLLCWLQKFFQMIVWICMLLMLHENVSILWKCLHACFQVFFSFLCFCTFSFFSFVVSEWSLLT